MRFISKIGWRSGGDLVLGLGGVVEEGFVGLRFLFLFGGDGQRIFVVQLLPELFHLGEGVGDLAGEDVPEALFLPLFVLGNLEVVDESLERFFVYFADISVVVGDILLDVLLLDEVAHVDLLGFLELVLLLLLDVLLHHRVDLARRHVVLDLLR